MKAASFLVRGRRGFATHSQPLKELLNHDPTQVAQMKDMMTLVDENDNVVGPISKLEGHLRGRTQLPHRAFSLLLFNSRFEMLLQRRSPKKITFPGLWTNACCSHNSHEAHELQAAPEFIGMRRAAVRRAKFELGIEELDPECDLRVGARILYKADSCETFAEHELDYIIFCVKDLTLWTPAHVNKDEVDSVAWVSRADLDGFLDTERARDGADITPWFRLLKNTKLHAWWAAIEQGRFPSESERIIRFL